MALAILGEAVARIEHKLDLLLKHLQAKVSPLHFVGNLCPVCTSPIDYQIDVGHNIVVRRCKCTTGKQPSIIPLKPVAPGDSNGTQTEQQGADSSKRGRGTSR